MENPQTIAENPPETGLFPETRVLQPCSANFCANGHSWRPTLAIAQCPGCTAPVIARKMENCPICNEPVERVSIRFDHIPAKSGIARLCYGDAQRGESTAVDLACQHFAAIELTDRPEEPNAIPTPTNS